MTVTACIVQARLGSTRLPAKVLLPLPTGRTVIEEVLFRCKQIKGVDVVALATPMVQAQRNDILAVFAHKVGDVRTFEVPVPENDVLARYAKVASILDADVIMRITADCPLIDPEVCGRVLAMVNRFDGDRWVFAANNEPRTFPLGFDCEVFTRALLGAANKEAHDREDREHVGPWMRRNATDKHFIFAEGENRSHLRWTLDTLDDYKVIWGVMEQQMREAA